MAEGDQKSPGRSRISEKDRYRYIGFEVFPGKPKDLFKNDAEKEKLVEAVRARRQSDETLREDCKLIEERVGFGEKLVMAVASLVILAALVLPWYSAYTVVRDETPEPTATEEVADSLTAAATVGDSLGRADSLALAGAALPDTAAAVAAEETAQPAGRQSGPGVVSHRGARANEEIITGHMARARTHREYTRLTGFGSFAAIGSVGSYVFSSGFVLVLSGVMMLIYGLLCVALPIVNIYNLFGVKGRPDEQAVRLKKVLRFNWLPLILLVFVMVLSFIGTDYGFNAEDTYTSLGASFGIGTVFNTLSWGVFVAMAASLLVAVKGIEI
jgi:hypothetical protein